MKVSIELTGGERVVRDLEAFGIGVQREVSRIVQGAAFNIEATAKRSIQRSPGTGNIYELYNPRRTHKASSPGNPPRTDTGALVSSITHEVSPDKLTAVVYSSLKYAWYLEYGTVKMDARPFFAPALANERPKFEAALDRIVDQAAKGII